MSQLGLFETSARKKYIPNSVITPRPYQVDSVENTFLGFDQNIGCMNRLPTGTGKTIVGSLIADRWIQQGDDYHVMCIASERELVWQFSAELTEVVRLEVGIEMASDRICEYAMPKLVCASRASLIVKDKTEDGEVFYPRLAKFDPELNWLLIWDEAHKHAYSLPSVRPIFDHFSVNPKFRQIGLTATPMRSDRRTLSRMFPYIASDYRLYDIAGGPCAITDGWAVAYDQKYIRVCDEVDFKALRTVKGDFDVTELDGILRDQATMAKLCDPMHELVGNRKTLIFSVTKQMAKDVANYLNAKEGCEVAKWVDGDVDAPARRRILDGHKRGDYQYLSCCGLCREGYNDPSIAAIIILRPTKSKSLAEQMKGRGCRPLRGLVDGLHTAAQRVEAIANSEKPTCLVVDMVGATGLGDCASTAHIYGGDKPDEVIDKANELSIACDGARPMPELIEEAEELVKAEEEARELAEKIAAEKKQREANQAKEARRRETLKAYVSYEAINVPQGGRAGAAHSSPRGTVCINFGKHAGTPWARVPDNYKRWMKEKTPGKYWGLMAAAKDHREAAPKPRPAPKPLPHISRSMDDINRMLRES